MMAFPSLFGQTEALNVGVSGADQSKHPRIEILPIEFGSRTQDERPPSYYTCRLWTPGNHSRGADQLQL